MRRILAAVAAIAMVAGGFLVRRGLNNPERGKAPLRLWCVPEAALACNELPGARTGRVVVTVDSPANFESRLKSMDPQALSVDAIVTDPWWIDRAKPLPPAVANTTPLAASAIVVAQREGDANCEGDIRCLTDRKASIPAIDAGITGPLAAASLFVITKADPANPDSDVVRANAHLLVELMKPIADGITPLQGLTSLKLLDAVVLSAAEFKQAAPAGVVSRPLRPPTEIRLTLAAYVADARLATLAEDLRAQLLRTGWQTPGAPRTSPSNVLLNEVYKVVR